MSEPSLYICFIFLIGWLIADRLRLNPGPCTLGQELGYCAVFPAPESPLIAYFLGFFFIYTIKKIVFQEQFKGEQVCSGSQRKGQHMVCATVPGFLDRFWRPNSHLHVCKASFLPTDWLPHPTSPLFRAKLLGVEETCPRTASLSDQHPKSINKPFYCRDSPSDLRV